MKNLLLSILFTLSFLGTQAQIITTIAGIGTQSYSGDNGPATDAGLHGPNDIAIDDFGNLYIADSYNNCIRKINTLGIITTIAGTGTAGYNGDNISASAAQLSRPYGVACDNSGNVFIADAFNHRIRRVDAISGIITTVAGTDTFGYNGDNIPATAARLYTPYCLEVDQSGNIYISDGENSRIRKVNGSGIITTIAGTGVAGFNGDNGLATSAQINRPAGLARDNAGNIYFADYYEMVVRKISPVGIITTVAGTGTSGFNGDNFSATAAKLNNPVGIAIDINGYIYIGDAQNQRVRMVNPVTGIITTVAGNGIHGFSGDNGLATAAALSSPGGIAFDNSGNMYLADFGNRRIRHITSTLSAGTLVKIDNDLKVYPNPSNGDFVLILNSSTNKQVRAVITNTIGQKIKELPIITNKAEKIQLDVPAGIYILSTAIGSHVYTERLMIIK